MDKIKISLSKNQIDRLAKGYDIHASRGTTQYTLGSKSTKEDKTLSKILSLENQLKKLRSGLTNETQVKVKKIKVRESVPTTCKECGKVCASDQGLTLHRRLKHEKSLKSNLKHLRK